MQDAALEILWARGHSGPDWRTAVSRESVEAALNDVVEAGQGHSGPDRCGDENRGVRFINLTDSAMSCRLLGMSTIQLTPVPGCSPSVSVRALATLRVVS